MQFHHYGQMVDVLNREQDMRSPLNQAQRPAQHLIPDRPVRTPKSAITESVENHRAKVARLESLLPSDVTLKSEGSVLDRGRILSVLNAWLVHQHSVRNRARYKAPGYSPLPPLSLT